MAELLSILRDKRLKLRARQSHLPPSPQHPFSRDGFVTGGDTVKGQHSERRRAAPRSALQTLQNAALPAALLVVVGVIAFASPVLRDTDATRAIDFFRQANVPVIGMVENTSGYACPHCGEVSDPFGQGGAQAAAGSIGIDFLGRVPLDIAIRTRSDAGSPPAADADDAVFAPLAEKLLGWLNPAKPAAF